MDDLKRRIYIKYELKRYLLKYLIYSNQVSPVIKIYSKYKIVLMPRFSLIIQQRNRCVLTGRVHNILRFAKYSRFAFRYNSNFLEMPGVKRFSR